jgi:NAD(P)-dependent dehydrogenase (short-subunit alcohol dehydrogenase family)
MKSLLSLALLAALSAGPAYAACTYPKAPDKVPDGNTATLQDMLESQKAVKQFDAEVTSYQGCLEAEHKAALAADATLTEEQKAERAKIVAQIPTGRLGSPDEIAYAVSFFVNEEAAWVTGANLSINGGHYMGW